VLRFLDVIFHAAALVVEAPRSTDSHSRLVTIASHYQSESPAGLAVIHNVHLMEDRTRCAAYSSCRAVDERDPFNDPILIDESLPFRLSRLANAQERHPSIFCDSAFYVNTYGLAIRQRLECYL